MATHTATVPWALTPRPKTTQPNAVTRAKFTDTEPAGENWRDRAECAKPEHDTAPWWPVGDSGPALLQIQEAKDVCNYRCPVVQQCAAYALRVGEPYGVWGGLSESDRTALLRLRARQRQQQARRAAA